jgi:hypothetical protein
VYKESCTQKCSEYKFEFHRKFGLVSKYQTNAALIKNRIRNVTIKEKSLGNYQDFFNF